MRCHLTGGSKTGRLFLAKMLLTQFLMKGSGMTEDENSKSSQENRLEALLEKQLAKSGGAETFSVKQLRRQIAAKRSGQTSKDLYVTGSFKRKSSD